MHSDVYRLNIIIYDVNKAVIVGIIVAAAVVIGVISALSYTNNSATNNEETTTGGTTTTEPLAQGRNLKIELNESVGITSNP